MQDMKLLHLPLQAIFFTKNVEFQLNFEITEIESAIIHLTLFK